MKGNAFAVEVRLTVERMEQERVTQFLTSRQDRLKSGLEQVILLRERIRQMNRTHAWLACNAVQFLQCHPWVSDGHRDAGHKAVRMRRMRFNSGIIDNLCEADALFRSCPLPRHSAGQGQDVHLNAMFVHPLDASIEVEIQRIRIGRRRPSHFDLSLCVTLGSPVRMHVDRNRANGRGVRGTRLPCGSLLRKSAAKVHACRRSRSDTKLEKAATIQRLRMTVLHSILRAPVILSAFRYDRVRHWDWKGL